jgi:glycosyl transferase family 2
MLSNPIGAEVALLSHINGDADILEAWLKYYQDLGIARFHLIVHGAAEENAQLFRVKNRYPIVIEDSYEGCFDSEEKKRRLNALLARMTGKWVMLVDSDEFVELPYRRIPKTIRMLQLSGANTLAAPMMQRLNSNGSLVDLEVGEDPFRVFPLCSPDLYIKMGVAAASIFKFPLFYCTERTSLIEGGNHSSPNGSHTVLSSLQGVTHHFKFRRSVLDRLDARIHSTHPWRHESVLYQQYLEAHSNRLPTTGSFVYSRRVLFRKGFLRKFTASQIATMTAKAHWKQRKFVRCFLAAACAVIMRPVLLGRRVKPLLQRLGLF